MSTNGTFRNNSLANPAGIKTINGQAVTLELLSTNPTNTAGVPRAWFNLTDFKIYVYDGTTQRATVALA